MSLQPVLVRCRGAARTFGHGSAAVVGLHDVSCEVRAGQRIVITGPSGSGKSTLLHLLGGIDSPTVGTVDWPALGSPAAWRPGVVGVVLQAAPLIPELTALENVALPLLLGGVEERAALDAALASLADLRLEDVAGHLPDELSGGQAQRVSAAQALATRPRLILADEPTGQLDRDNAEQLIGALLGRAAALHAALVVTTHDSAVAAAFADRWTMVDGSLQPETTTLLAAQPC
jgi:ABC-type lipoprotein export system ATPase subunit